VRTFVWADYEIPGIMMATGTAVAVASVAGAVAVCAETGGILCAAVIGPSLMSAAGGAYMASEGIDDLFNHQLYNPTGGPSSNAGVPSKDGCSN
jgi:hypothetical protein